MKPLISVIIPTHMRPDLLKRALASVTQQSYKNLQIIVVDDSLDTKIQNQNKKNISSFKDKRITYYKNTHNKGGSGARNTGINKIKGKYTAFLDDDDVWLKNKLEKQFNLFKKSKNKKLGIVLCLIKNIVVNNNNKQIMVLKPKFIGNMFNSFLNSFVIAITSASLIKTDIIKKQGGFDENMKSSQEYDLMVRYSEKAEFDFVNEILVTKYEYPDRVSTNFKNKLQGMNYFFKKHKKHYKNLPKQQQFNNWLRKNILRLIYLLGILLGDIIFKPIYKINEWRMRNI